MHWQDVRSRVRSFFVDEDEFAAILRGAGLAIVIRVLAAAIGYANMVLLARWMGVAEFGYYSFAIAWLTLLAYPSSLGLPGSALLFVARYKTEGDWPKVLGLIRTVSRISFGCGMAVALIGILATLYARAFLEPGYVNPTLLALCGIPIVH